MPKTTLTITIMLLTMTLSGCPRSADVTPMPPVVTDQDMCSPACHNLQKLQCKEGNPIDMKAKCMTQADCRGKATCSNGRCTTSCTDFCVDTENQGVWLDPGCVATITSCADIDKCPLKGLTK